MWRTSSEKPDLPTPHHLALSHAVGVRFRMQLQDDRRTDAAERSCSCLQNMRRAIYRLIVEIVGGHQVKVTHYSVTAPWPGVTKQHSIMARSGDKSNGYFPIVYLQRPKWIKDDAAWETICNSIQLNLPKNFEVT